MSSNTVEFFTPEDLLIIVRLFLSDNTATGSATPLSLSTNQHITHWMQHCSKKAVASIPAHRSMPRHSSIHNIITCSPPWHHASQHSIPLGIASCEGVYMICDDAWFHGRGHCKLKEKE
eukprot:scaffold89801_cov14-Tisochrysis_lutea.AAC.1